MLIFEVYNEQLSVNVITVGERNGVQCNDGYIYCSTQDSQPIPSNLLA